MLENVLPKVLDVMIIQRQQNSAKHFHWQFGYEYFAFFCKIRKIFVDKYTFFFRHKMPESVFSSNSMHLRNQNNRVYGIF